MQQPQPPLLFKTNFEEKHLYQLYPYLNQSPLKTVRALKVIGGLLLFILPVATYIFIRAEKLTAENATFLSRQATLFLAAILIGGLIFYGISLLVRHRKHIEEVRKLIETTLQKGQAEIILTGMGMTIKYADGPESMGWQEIGRAALGNDVIHITSSVASQKKLYWVLPKGNIADDSWLAIQEYIQKRAPKSFKL